MAGAFYIWFMAAFFIGLVGVMALLFGIFYIGHWLEKRQTGAQHGFLEMPEELRSGGKTGLPTEGIEGTEKEG